MRGDTESESSCTKKNQLENSEGVAVFVSDYLYNSLLERLQLAADTKMKPTCISLRMRFISSVEYGISPVDQTSEEDQERPSTTKELHDGDNVCVYMHDSFVDVSCAIYSIIRSIENSWSSTFLTAS